MKDKLYEQLSALVDDELTGSEYTMLVKRVEGDKQLYQRLSRYQLISDALQNHLPDRVDPAFSRRVKGSLRSEPALSRSSGLGAVMKPLAALALAASVAVMAVMTIQSVRRETSPPAETVATVPQEMSPPAETVATVPQETGYMQVNDEPGATARALVDRKLDIYLVNHNEYAVNHGVQGMLPYVRIVGHDMTRSAQE
jgi:sigma-E factor negative regulatory protein RseA